MIAALYQHQVRTLLATKRARGLAILVLVPGLILAVVGSVEDSGSDALPAVTLLIASTIFPIAVLILAAATLREERDAGTLPYLYAKPIPRPTLAAVAVASAATATLALAAVATLGLAAGALIIGVSVAEALRTLSLFGAAAVGYSAVFVPAGFLWPRIILVGLGYVIVWEQIIARLVTGVANTSIWRIGVSIYADITTTSGGDAADVFDVALGPVTAGSWGGLAKLAVVVALGIGLLTWILRRRDAV